MNDGIGKKSIVHIGVSPFAMLAYGLILGACCGFISAFPPTWTILTVTQIQNAATLSARALAQRDRQDLNRRMDGRLKDLNATILSACKGK